MITRLERGDEKEAAASFAYSSTAYPRLAGTLVTIAAFVPIGFGGSAAGEYTFSIFAVVGYSPDRLPGALRPCLRRLLGVWVLKKPKAAHDVELRLHHARLPVASFCLRAGRAGSRLSSRSRCSKAAIFGMRFVPQQFFPASDRPELLVDLQLPQNASIEATENASAGLDKILKDDQDIDHWSTYVGQGSGPLLSASQRAAPKLIFRAGRRRHEGT